MAARVKRSGVWEYFVLQVTDDSKVSCSLCNAVISRGGKDTKNFNTSNMRYHLETKHPDEYKQLAAKEKELSKEKVGGSNQPTLLESFVKSQPFVFDHPRAKEITKRIGEMMRAIHHGKSYWFCSFVESPGTFHQINIFLKH